jgi:hypothetical protein
MPDQRKHRGPHPEDARLFAAALAPTLRQATAELAWLLTRGYPREAALKLVGDRYGLLARQRIAVARCASSDQEAARRRAGQCEVDALGGRPLWLDGYNVLTTVEAALAGGVVLAARDGAYRDMASMHGSYRKVAETPVALDRIGRTVAELGVSECCWYLDRPVSNSGRLKTIMESVSILRGWCWRVELVADPDGLLAVAEEIVATADSAILDRCGAWFNLARTVVARYVPEAWVLDLAGG